MRLVCISDTHHMHRQIERIPDGDVLIHAGDCLSRGGADELEEFGAWFSQQPHRHKILVAGNHDWCLERDPKLAREHLTQAVYLEDSATVIDGVKFWGTPWTKPYSGRWAFQLTDEARAAKWALIPQDTDVLITHSPAFGIFDCVRQSDGLIDRAGCDQLLRRVAQLSLKAHICGHIHQGYGFARRESDGVKFANASTCNAERRPLCKAPAFSCTAD